jgi:hypothetical protein
MHSQSVVVLRVALYTYPEGTEWTFGGTACESAQLAFGRSAKEGPVQPRANVENYALFPISRSIVYDAPCVSGASQCR